MAFDYASRDYDTIKSDLLVRASRTLPEWTDRDPSDFGMLFVDLWAHAADVLHYYADRAAAESNLATAQQRESVLALANLFDYTPRPRTNATGSVVLYNSSSSNITIPAFTRFVARHDNTTYHFYTPTDATLYANSNTSVSLREGVIVTEEVLGTSNGSIDQMYTLNYKNVVHDTIYVTVEETADVPVPYRSIVRLADAIVGERVYSVYTTADSETEIHFGNTIRGFSPPSGAVIKVRYAYGSGAKGNIDANSVTGFYGTTPDYVSVISSSSFAAGNDDESMVSIRSTLPSAISAQNRAVTREDYRNVALQVGAVAKVAVTYDASTNTVTIHAHEASDNFLAVTLNQSAQNTDLETEIATYVGAKAMLGVTVAATTVIDYINIYLKPKVYVNNRFVSAWVKQDVADAIDDLFAFDNIYYGQRIDIGLIYRTILNVRGVDYVTIDTADGSYFNAGAQTNGAYVPGATNNNTVQQTIQLGDTQLPKLVVDATYHSIRDILEVSGGIPGT